MAPEHRWMTTDEVADGLGVSRSTVRRWLRERKLEGHRIGKRWLVRQPGVGDLTVAQAAELVRAHPDTVRRWLAAGKLPGRRVGHRWSIQEAALIDLVEGDTATGYQMSNN